MYTVWIIWLWYPNRNLAVCLWEFNMSFIVYSIRNSPLQYYSHISQTIAYTLYPNIWFSQKSIRINKQNPYTPECSETKFRMKRQAFLHLIWFLQQFIHQTSATSCQNVSISEISMAFTSLMLTDRIMLKFYL